VKGEMKMEAEDFWDYLSENLLLERKNVNNALEDALEGYKEPSINAIESGIRVTLWKSVLN
jgi:hypothetical protein